MFYNIGHLMTLPVASPTIVILTTLEVLFMLLDNTYSTGITNDDHHDDHDDNCNIFIVQAATAV
jgi:hypothetical protein